MKAGLIITTFVALSVPICVSAQPKTGAPDTESTPFWVRSVTTGKVRQLTIKNAKQIQENRVQSSLPSEGQTVVPLKLRELVLDFAVLLDGGGKHCSNYQFREIRPSSSGEKSEEIWVIGACGTSLALKVAKGSCGNFIGSEYVSVTAAYAKTGILYGTVPLIVNDLFTFLPACENIN